MNENPISTDMTRRQALKIGAGVVASAAGAALAQTGPKASRIHEYSWVRGFNYQPSWGSHGITIWNDFREATYAKEIEQGLKHFPKINTLRIWFSYDAHVADRKTFLAAAKRVGAPYIIKVLDFGIAKVASEAKTSNTAAIGTPIWMAPEQSARGQSVSPATDVIIGTLAEAL